MKALTLVLPFYRNAGMLREQQRCWRALPDDLRKRLHVIVVDDCSPEGFEALPAVETDRGSVGSFRLFRTGVDVRWNWLFCRNLGVEKAATDWVLLTDMDHVLPEKTLRHLLTAKMDMHNVYRFSRVDAPQLTPYKPHPNSWFMTRSMFDSVGGYDERLSGCYGTDGEFKDRINATARRVVMLEQPLVRYPREVIADASTTVFTRKGDPDNDEELRRRRKARAAVPNWRPLRLMFPWEQLI